MKYSAKLTSPQEFEDWKALANSDWQPDWDNFQNPENRAVRQSLLKEQGYVCAYCGRSVKVDGTDSHIDHFWPRHYYRPRELNYDNFFASCGPEKVKNAPKICGDAKEDWHDPANLTLIPSDPTCETRFRYSANGKMDAANDADRIAAVFITQLNLNEVGLKDDRKKILTALETDIKNGLLTAADKASEITLWRALDPEGRAKSLGHVAANYLDREL